MESHDSHFESVRASGYGPPGGPPPGGYGPPGGGGPPGYGGPPGGGGYGPPPGGGYGPPGGGYGPPGGGYGPPGGGGFGPPPGGFGPPGAPPGMMVPGGQQPPWQPLAVVSLISGVLSMPTCFCSCFAPGINSPLALLAVVCGIAALNKIKAAPQAWRGSGMAIAGIVTGGMGLLLVFLAAFTTLDETIRGHSRL